MSTSNCKAGEGDGERCSMLEKKDERRRVWEMSNSNCKGGGEVQGVKGEGFVLRDEHLRTVRAWRERTEGGGGGRGKWCSVLEEEGDWFKEMSTATCVLQESEDRGDWRMLWWGR